MERTFPLWLIVAFPLGAGVLLATVGRPIGRIWPEERGRTLVHYLALFAAVMSALLTFQAVRQGILGAGAATLVDQRGAWFDLSGGATTGAFELRLVLDRVSAPFLAGVTGATCLLALFALTRWRGAVDVVARRWGLLLATEAAAAALLMVDGAEELVVVWGLAAVLLAACAWAFADDVVARDTLRRSLGTEALGVAAFGVGIWTLAVALPATSFEAFRLAALPQEGSLLRHGGPLGLVRVEFALALILLGFATRTGAWPFACPQDRAPNRSPEVVPVLRFVFGVGPVVYLLVRLDVVLALAPQTMAALAVWGAVIALIHGGRALRCRVTVGDDDERAGLGRVSEGLAGGVMWVFLGFGAFAWAVAGWLVLGLGLMVGAMTRAVWRGRWSALADAGSLRLATWLALGTGMQAFPAAGALGLGGAVWVAVSHQSTWSPGVNFLVAGVLVVAVLCASLGQGAALHAATRRDGPAGGEGEGGLDGDAREEIAAQLTTPLLGALAAAVLTALWFLQPDAIATWLAPRLAAVEAFAGDFAVGTRPGFESLSGPAQLVIGMVVVVASLGMLGAVARWVHVAAVDGPLAPVARACDRVWALALVIPERLGRGLDLLSQLIELGAEQSLLQDGGAELRRTLIRPWDMLLDRESRMAGPRRAAYIVAGALLLLGWMLLKPEVSTLAPNGIHGFGGLSPVILTPRTGSDDDDDDARAGEASEADDSASPREATDSRAATDGGEP